MSAQKGEVDHDVLAALAWKLVPVEVPPHVEEILGPYPELLEQWKAQMALPCMQEPGWSGTLKRYLDPVYMRGVAFEHGRLIEGNIERPEPELSTAIEAALQLHAGMRQKRAEHLSDPWWRAMSYDWNGIAEYHDPDYLNRFAPCVPELVVEVLELVCSWLTTAQTTQTIHGPDSPHPYGFVD